MNHKIPLGKPFIENDELNAVINVLKSGLIAYGNQVRDFEEEFAKKMGRKYCIMVNSGTSALWLGIKSLEFINTIIIPSLTCNSVLNSVLSAGSNIIFADVDEETHNIDLSSIPEWQLEEADGLIVTHAYGHSVDFDTINQYVKDYNLTLIEDFAQATGGYFKDKRLGSLGKLSVTSFYGPKNMTTGYGGAILTDDFEIYKKCLYGRGDNLIEYYQNFIPMNLRMTDIQAAIGIIQLKKLDKMIEMRRDVAKRIKENLSDLNVGLPIEKKYANHTYYKFHIILPEKIKKFEFINNMKSLGVSAGILYDPPLHKTKMAMDIFSNLPTLPISEFLSPRTVSIPMYPELNDREIKKIINAIKLSI